MITSRVYGESVGGNPHIFQEKLAREPLPNLMFVVLFALFFGKCNKGTPYYTKNGGVKGGGKTGIRSEEVACSKK